MTSQPKPVNSASRAVAIIEFLAARPTQTYSLSEIARRLGLNKSTAHTLIHTLHSAGWLFYSPHVMRYGLGPRLTMIGEAAAQCVPELAVARPVMNELAADLQVDCMFSTVVKDEIVVLGSTGPMRLGEPTARVGIRMPCAPPLGTVFLAWFSDVERAERLREGLDHGYQALATELAAIRRRGYVATLKSTDENRLTRVLSDISETYSSRSDLRFAVEQRMAEIKPTDYLASHSRSTPPQEIASIQAPVFQQDSPRFALTVSHLSGQLTVTELSRLGRQIREAANEITNSIGQLETDTRSVI